MRAHLLLLFRFASALGVSVLLATSAASIQLSSSAVVAGPGRPGCSVQDTAFAETSDLSCAGAVVGQYRLTAQATAGYGTLRATAQVGYTNVSIGGNDLIGTAAAQSTFTDDITLDVPGRTGEVVMLKFHASLSGSANASVSGSVSTLLALASGGLHVTVAGERLSINDQWDSRTGLFRFNDGPKSVQITLGQPFQIQSSLGANASIRDLSSTSSIVTVTNGSAIAPFGASGGPTAFELSDLSGAPIPGFSLSSASGQFQFFVPEPSLGLLLGTALAAARLRRASKRLN